MLPLALALSGLAFSRAEGLETLSSYPIDVDYTKHFAFEVYTEPLPALTALTARADEVYRYVSDRLGVSYSGRIEVAVEARSDRPCPVRGTFVPDLGDGPGLVVYADERTGPAELLGILAHELGHFLHAAGFGEFPSSAGLNEGLASWAAGRYWLRWHRTPSLAASVRAYRARGTYLRLENKFEFGVYRGSATCLERRDRLYTEWAAFTDFLIATYGVQKFKVLLASADINVNLESGKRSGTPPDYKAVYGQTLGQLEAAWLRRPGPGVGPG